MVILKRTTPTPLSAFLTAPSLPPTTIDRILADFRLGAHDAYDPSVRLVLDRSRFLNASPEEVRVALDNDDESREGEPFLIIDEGSRDGRSVLWVDGWAEGDWVRENMGDVESEGGDGDGGRGRVLLMVRMVVADVPSHHLSTLTAETDIFDSLPLPYDPHVSQTQPPPASIYDWENSPPLPPPIHVVAAPEEFEISTEPRDVQRFLIPPNGHPREVVRLKESVARGVGLRSGWAVGMPAAIEEGMPEGSLVFEQEWDTDGGG